MHFLFHFILVFMNFLSEGLCRADLPVQFSALKCDELRVNSFLYEQENGILARAVGYRLKEIYRYHLSWSCDVQNARMLLYVSVLNV